MPSRFIACAVAALAAAPALAGANEAPLALETASLELAQLAPVPNLPEAGPARVAQAEPAKAEEELRKAKAELEAAVAALKSLAQDPSLSAEQKVKVYESLSGLQSALERVNRSLAGGDRQAKLDAHIAEARLIQRVMSGYFGNQGTFGYQLKRGAVELEVGADAIYDVVAKKLPFLRGAVGGRVRINPGNEAVNQFNALKAEYYGALLEAAHLDKKDSRLKAMADWGGNTSVVYPGETFGKPILDGHQRFALN